MIINNRDRNNRETQLDVDLTDAVEAAAQALVRKEYGDETWVALTGMEQHGFLEEVTPIVMAATPHIISQVT